MIDINTIIRIMKSIKQPAVIIDNKEVNEWNEGFVNLLQYKNINDPKLLFSSLNPLMYYEDNTLVSLLGQNYLMNKIALIDSKLNKQCYLFIFSTALSNEAFDDMLLSISHELKTPLTKISLVASLLNQEDEEIKILNRSIDTLKKTIDSLLEMGTIEHWWVDYYAVDMHELIKKIVTKYKNTIDNKKIEVTINQDEEVPNIIHLLGGNYIIERTLYSIIDNAMTHVDMKGKVLVDISKHNNYLTCIVEDNGSGIKRENIEKIFRPFFSEDKSRKESKSGLGLYIVKKLVDRVGGNVLVESILNKGTKFIIQLPLQIKS